ncbi:MAG: hypothetical protein R3F61_34465 [Myxococcota bacterium]
MRSLLMFAVLAGSPALAADGAALLAASELPMKAKEARDSGLDADQVVSAIDAAKGASLSAADTAEMLGATGPLVKEHGAVENFGDFVKGKLEEGLRGQDLANAIKAEHENKGKGGGKPAPKDGEAPKPDTKPDAKPDPKPVTRPVQKPGPLTRPGSGGTTRPGGGATRPSSGGGDAPKPRPSGGGGGMTRPGGAR